VSKCSECGAECSGGELVCGKCGCPIKVTKSSFTTEINNYGLSKSPEIAAILNYILPGIGNMYIGQILKGVVASLIYITFLSQLIGAVINDVVKSFPSAVMSGITGGSSSGSISGGTLFLLLLVAGIWVIMLADAYKLATRLRESKEIGKFDFFWSNK
jgi:TM2 domain-containing membrane protein YozV